MNPTPHIDALARELEAFIDLLEREASALAANQADALSPLTTQRDSTNRRLTALWLNLTGSLGLPGDSSLATLSEHCFALAPDAWRKLDELARHAERMNRLNSRLIDEQLRRTQVAVQVLRNAAGGRALYGADGRASDLFNPNRSIDTA
jgi:flagellar biosynthesis/type III secretory pathway chaperone